MYNLIGQQITLLLIIMDKSRMKNLHSLINDIFTKFLSGKN